MITLSGVTVEYRSGPQTVRALDGIDMSIETGEFVAIMGPSGSGKTSLVHVIGGLMTPTRGTVLVDDVQIGRLDEDRLARYRNQSIGFVFQLFHLQPDDRAVENVELPLIIAGVDPEERRTRALNWLDRVGLADRAQHYPSQMSGGEMQRVAVARALVNDPRILLADEPTGNLDRKAADSVIDLLLRMRSDLGMTIVMVTHNPVLAERADRVIRIENGEIA